MPGSCGRSSAWETAISSEKGRGPAIGTGPLPLVVDMVIKFYHERGLGAMTKQHLDRHLELRQQLAADLELLASLEAAAAPRAQRLDGMPHAHGVSDPTGNLAAEIADMRETVARRQAAVAHSEETVAAYIGTIEDSQTRMIFRLRYVHGMAWKDVAAAVGGRNTENSVKSVCYRYIARAGPARMGRPPKRKERTNAEKIAFDSVAKGG